MKTSRKDATYTIHAVIMPWRGIFVIKKYRENSSPNIYNN